MRVVSLFDGIACGLVALKKAGITVDEYHAFEIDKHAIDCAIANNPEIIEHGSVIGYDFSKFKNIDLLIGGSPCQDFSILGREKGFAGENGKLFFEFVRALHEIKPKYFLFENVVVKEEIRAQISKLLACPPIFINSRHFSAQNRKRLYWTNIPLQPLYCAQESNFLLKDIVDFSGKNVTQKVIKYLSDEYINRRVQKVIKYTIVNDFYKKSKCVVAKCFLGCTQGIIFQRNNEYFIPSVSELEKLQTLPVGYCKDMKYTNAVHAIGNAWNVNTIAFLFKGLINNEKINEQ